MEQTGYSTANLSGSVRYLTLYVSTGKVAASDLEVMSAEVNAQSKAEVSLWITDRFVGKTTTKECIAHVLAGALPVLRNRGNLNNEQCGY